MDGLLTLIPITAFAYLATNLDNFLLLLTMLANNRHRHSAVFAGYFLCMAVLIFASFLIGGASDDVPVEYIGLLGLVPVALGVSGVWKLWRGSGKDSNANDAPIGSWRGAFFAVFLTQIGNGGDTLVTFGVLFADSMAAADTTIFATVAISAAAVAWLANYALYHLDLRQWINRYADRIAPFILIAVGAYILANTATDLA